MTRCLKLQSLSSSQFPSTDSNNNIADWLGKAESSDRLYTNLNRVEAYAESTT
jgi:hypothetical protein